MVRFYLYKKIKQKRNQLSELIDYETPSLIEMARILRVVTECVQKEEVAHRVVPGEVDKRPLVEVVGRSDVDKARIELLR